MLHPAKVSLFLLFQATEFDSCFRLCFSQHPGTAPLITQKTHDAQQSLGALSHLLFPIRDSIYCWHQNSEPKESTVVLRMEIAPRSYMKKKLVNLDNPGIEKSRIPPELQKYIFQSKFLQELQNYIFAGCSRSIFLQKFEKYIFAISKRFRSRHFFRVRITIPIEKMWLIHCG